MNINLVCRITIKIIQNQINILDNYISFIIILEFVREKYICGPNFTNSDCCFNPFYGLRDKVEFSQGEWGSCMRFSASTSLNNTVIIMCSCFVIINEVGIWKQQNDRAKTRSLSLSWPSG